MFKMKKKYIWILLIPIALVVIIISVFSIINAPYSWSVQLVNAIEKDDITTVENLLQKGYDVNTPTSKPNRIWDAFTESMPKVPLAVASYYGNYDIVKLFIDHGAKASYIPGTSWSPLTESLRHYQQDDLKVITLLLENGADPGFVEDGEYPILLAASLRPEPSGEESEEEAEQNCLKIFKLMENNGADINSNGSGGINALLEAAATNNTLVLKYLLEEKGFDVNYSDTSKMTALMLSVYWEDANEDTIKILLENGANISLKDENGKSAYDYAIQNGNEEFAELLKP